MCLYVYFILFRGERLNLPITDLLTEETDLLTLGLNVVFTFFAGYAIIKMWLTIIVLSKVWLLTVFTWFRNWLANIYEILNLIIFSYLISIYLFLHGNSFKSFIIPRFTSCSWLIWNLESRQREKKYKFWLHFSILLLCFCLFFGMGECVQTSDCICEPYRFLRPMRVTSLPSVWVSHWRRGTGFSCADVHPSYHTESVTL